MSKVPVVNGIETSSCILHRFCEKCLKTDIHFIVKKFLLPFSFSIFFITFLQKKLFQGKVSPDEAPKNTLESFKFFWKIHEDIHKWKYTIGINNTGGKFATGVNNTSGKFATSAEFATDINNMRQILPLVPLVSTTPMANRRRYK
jgi:hypothetical protein